MTGPHEQDFEKLLKSLPLSPVPPGLRERIFRESRARRRANAEIPPFLLKGIAACTALSVFFFVADVLLSRSERNRVMAFLNEPMASETNATEERLLLAEEMGAPLASKMISPGQKTSSRFNRDSQIRWGAYRGELMREIFGGDEHGKKGS